MSQHQRKMRLFQSRRTNIKHFLLGNHFKVKKGKIKLNWSVFMFHFFHLYTLLLQNNIALLKSCNIPAQNLCIYRSRNCITCNYCIYSTSEIPVSSVRNVDCVYFSWLARSLKRRQHWVCVRQLPNIWRRLRHRKLSMKTGRAFGVRLLI